MKKIIIFLIIFLTFISQSFCHIGPDEKKYRIAYYEGGPYIDYHKVFSSMIEILIKKNKIPFIKIPEPDGKDIHQFWKKLAEITESQNSKIVFVKDRIYFK